MKHIHLKIILLVILLDVQTALCQDEKENPKKSFDEEIMTDRPDQTEAPNLTPKGWFQIETGAQREFDDSRSVRTHWEKTLYNTTLWKYGLTQSFELRLITEYAGDKIRFKNAARDTVISFSGWNPVMVGGKIAILNEKGIIPKTSLIGHLILPYFGYDDYKPTFITPKFRFVFSHKLNRVFNLSYNLGMEWQDGTVAAGTVIYTASLETIFTKKFSMFLESYGFLKEKSLPDHRFDAGLMYLLNSNFQLDLSGGFGLTDISPDYFISAGLSFRFNAFDRER
jgi:hypothetical protein